MSIENQQTLEVYNNGVSEYIHGTVQQTDGPQKEWLDFVFLDIPVDARVLEIGSAFGRDARYIIGKGYDVDLTDASTGFVDYLRKEGHVAELLDIVRQALDKKYDVILACAVFLHFTTEDFRRAVINVRSMLGKDGRFAFSVKRGDGDEWTDNKMGAPRYFRYYQEAELGKILDTLGMQIIDSRVLSDKWIHVVCKVKV